MKSSLFRKISTFSISTACSSVFFPLNLSLQLTADRPEASVSFLLPGEENVHTLFLQLGQREFIPSAEPQFAFFSAAYEIVPPLSERCHIQFDTSTAHALPSADTRLPEGAASIGIIGSADGPTVLFFSEKGGDENTRTGAHGCPVYTCYSKLTEEIHTQTAEFCIQGICQTKDDKKIYSFQSGVPDRCTSKKQDTNIKRFCNRKRDR